MKKMMLVIDEPGSCMECPCAKRVGLVDIPRKFACQALHELHYTDREIGRPIYCPLLEVEHET